MQKQFTIEVRCDFADAGRFEAARQLGLECVKHFLAGVQLLAEGDVLKQKPNSAFYADDFFTGHEEIDAMEDIIAKAEKQFGHLTKHKSGADGVSEDLAEALRDLREQDANA
jgi:hypothetical protein